MNKTFHYFAGAALAVFILTHLGNHLVALSGVDNHILVMELLRKVYRNIFVESLLLLMLAVQIPSGLKLAWAKRKEIKDKWVLLQVVSGIYLMFFLVVHVSAVMFGRFQLKLDTNIYFAMAGLNTENYRLFFIPYYSLSILFFFGHVAAIHRFKMNRSLAGMGVESQAVSILALGFMLAFGIIYAMTDGFSMASFPEDYKILVP